MPPHRHRNPYPSPPRRRRLVALVVPALVGAALALAVVALAGGLRPPEPTVVVREPVYLPAVAEAPAPPATTGGAVDAGSAGSKSVQRIVREASPAVVTVTSGGPLHSRLGSGFVVDRKGRVLTNEHVVAESGPVTVTFADGTEARARVLGRDPSADLAVLRVPELPDGTRPLPLGRSADLRVGDPVVTIGNPFGLEGTTTTGIVSAVKRVITAPNDFRIQNVIQTDAAINQGNSGGPLLDRRGRVVGINSQIATESGGNDGVGFAVPIDTIVPVMESIILTGEARHAWLGITGRAITPAIAEALGTPGARGVVVVEVDERSPAHDAGLRAAADPKADVPRGGDLIVGVGDGPVTDMADVSQAVAARRVGDRLTLAVLRDGARLELAVRLADRPGDVGIAAARG